jgi:hypothetical protein
LFEPSVDVDAVPLDVLDFFLSVLDELFFAAVLDRVSTVGVAFWLFDPPNDVVAALSVPSALGAAFCLFEPTVDVDAVPLDMLDFFLSVMDELFFVAVLDRVSTVGVAFWLFDPPDDVDAALSVVLFFFL